MRCAAPGNVPASAESAAKEAVPTRPLSSAGVQHAKPSTSASTHATAAGPAQVHIRYAGAPAVGVGTHAAPSVNPGSADDAYRGAALGARVRGRRSEGRRRFDPRTRLRCQLDAVAIRCRPVRIGRGRKIGRTRADTLAAQSHPVLSQGRCHRPRACPAHAHATLSSATRQRNHARDRLQDLARCRAPIATCPRHASLHDRLPLIIADQSNRSVREGQHPLGLLRSTVN